MGPYSVGNSAFRLFAVRHQVLGLLTKARKESVVLTQELVEHTQLQAERFLAQSAGELASHVDIVVYGVGDMLYVKVDPLTEVGKRVVEQYKLITSAGGFVGPGIPSA